MENEDIETYSCSECRTPDFKLIRIKNDLNTICNNCGTLTSVMNLAGNLMQKKQIELEQKLQEMK